MPLTLQADPVNDMLAKFAQLSGRGITDLVRANARLAAVELANRTQPWTSKNDKGADVLGKVSKTVTTDVKKVIKAKDDFETYISSAIQDDRIKKRLLQVANSGRYDLLGKIMFNCGMITSEDNIHRVTSESDHSSKHKEFRDRNGRTYKPPGQFNISQGSLTAYIQNVLKRIGYAKSGWAECAREIGGIKGDGARGIPAFAKRQRGNNFSVQKSDQQYTMTNTTPYIDRLCDSSAKQAAVDKASENLLKSLIKAFDAATKKDSVMKEIIEQEIDKTL